MAGIYIPGLGMLKCDECFWCIGHRIKCPAGSKDVLLGGRHPDCPLIPVPPHGRLGDLGALEKILKEKQDEYKARDLLATHELSEAMRFGFDAAVGHVLLASTIIPAEIEAAKEGRP